MKGRKPKPGAVRKAQGNPGHRAIPADPTRESSAEKSALLPFVKLSDAARLAYNIIGADLRAARFLRTTDEPLFARYCDQLARYWRLTDALNKFGDETYETDSAHGKMQRLRPHFVAQQLCAKRLESMEDRLGLSPMARQQYLIRLAAGATGDLFGPLRQDDSKTKTQTTPGPAAEKPSAIGALRTTH